MTRIYMGLAGFAMLLLSVSLVLGLIIGDYNGTARAMIESKRVLHGLRREVTEDARMAARAEVSDAATKFSPVRQRATLHKLVGIAATLVAVLVHSISVTYFIGTARWCQEVVLRYNLDPRLAQRSQQLKRRSFPWSLGGILLILLVAALGGAADPGANYATAPGWVTPHLLAALTVVALSAWSYMKQIEYIRENLQAIDVILQEVARIRHDKGWDAPGAPAA